MALSAPQNPPTEALLITHRRRRDSRSAQLASQVVVVIGFLIVWELFSLTPFAIKAEMPGPVATIGQLLQLIVTESFWSTLGTTAGSWAAALCIALVVGIPVGLAIGRSRRAFESTKWTIDFVRTIPSVAIVPLALLVLGASQRMVIVVGAIPALWPLVVQAISAGQQADPHLHRVARSFRLRATDRLVYVLAPDVLAFIWPGIRLATTSALLVVVFAELLGGGTNGIGSQINNAQLYDAPTTMYAWVLTSCLLGLAINSILAAIQRRVLWWHPSMRGRE